MNYAPLDNTSVAITASLLNKAALAARLSLSVRTIDNMVKAREFPPGVRVGRCVYWTEAAVTAWHTRVFSVQQGWRP
jgi:predicted DNA-binding transcriptional regulator AlpA